MDFLGVALFIGGIALFLAVLVVTVAIHEAGHMAVAKAVKLDVPEYSIGFGPKLFTYKTAKTAYSIRLIPLGGFVMIKDNRYPDKSYEQLTLSRVKPWKRQLVFLAGPAVNIIVGAIVLIAVLMATPYQKPANVVSALSTCANGAQCGAAEAGLKVGDIIVNIDGQKVSNHKDIDTAKEGKTVLQDVTVMRDGKRVQIHDLKLHKDEASGESLMGIQASVEAHRTFGDAWTFVESSAKANLVAIVQLPDKLPGVVQSIVSGHKNEGDPASVVATGKNYGSLATDTATTQENKAFTYIYWSALLNLGIGFINLVPLLPLDGGRMWLAFCDTIRIRWFRLRKKKYQPVTQRMFNALTATSAIAVFGFMGLIIASDVSAIVTGNL